jgi:hypothetical protein
MLSAHAHAQPQACWKGPMHPPVHPMLQLALLARVITQWAPAFTPPKATNNFTDPQAPLRPPGLSSGWAVFANITDPVSFGPASLASLARMTRRGANPLAVAWQHHAWLPDLALTSATFRQAIVPGSAPGSYNSGGWLEGAHVQACRCSCAGGHLLGGENLLVHHHCRNSSRDDCCAVQQLSLYGRTCRPSSSLIARLQAMLQ